MSIIALSGKIGSGKDTVATIIDSLYHGLSNKTIITLVERNIHSVYQFHRKKFADKLKDIVCILLGCTREQLEDREFKEKELGEEWWYWKPYKGLRLLPYNAATGSEVYTLVKPTPRLLMQLMGTECGRNILHPNVWVNALMSEYKEKIISESFYDENANNYTGITNIFTTELPNWIITDMRFPNELKAVKSKGGITIRINRGTLSMVKMMEEHESERALDTATFDYVIDNTGTIEELIEKVREILIKEKII